MKLDEHAHPLFYPPRNELYCLGCLVFGNTEILGPFLVLKKIEMLPWLLCVVVGALVVCFRCVSGGVPLTGLLWQTLRCNEAQQDQKHQGMLFRP